MSKSRVKAFLLLSLFILMAFAGCQETPEKSAVVSKAGGLSQDVIAEPMKEGETRKLDIPEHWKALEKRSSDRVLIEADLPLEPVIAENLPVIEMQNHVMTQEELVKLVEYFAGNDSLYIPNVTVKEEYRQVKKRIDNQEGAYANVDLRPYYKQVAENLEKAIGIAPDEQPKQQKVEIKFQEKAMNEAWYTAKNMDVPVINNLQCNFSADVGDDRQAHIEAMQYEPDVGNISSFTWELGVTAISEMDLQYFEELNDVNRVNGTVGYYAEWQNLLEMFRSVLNQEPITVNAGREEAEQLLENLDFIDLELVSVQKVLWFPKEESTGLVVGALEDFMFQANLEKAKTGYEYSYAHTVSGLSIDRLWGSIVTQETADTYAPPFSVETVTVVVTEDGVQKFSWGGMCETVSIVAENTNLLSFDEIQGKLFDQIYYRYTGMGQPAESKMKFSYQVMNARLGYTYVTAYEKPDHAWLVPAWFFTVKEHCDDLESQGTGAEYDRQTMEFMLNALDGGAIGGSF